MRRLTLVFILITALGLVPAAAAWTWPLGGDVLRPYSLGPDAYAAGQHRGVDVAGAGGESVRAPASGTVSFAGVVPGSGRTVTIQLDGYAASVTHLGEISISKGAMVVEGQTIGIAGQSGDAEWPTPYVHLGIRVSAAADGYVDPATLLPPRTAAPPPSAGAPVAAPVVVPVVAPVAVPVVPPVAVPGGTPGVVPAVVPTVAPVTVQISTPGPAPRTSRPPATAPVAVVDSRQSPAAAASPSEPVSAVVPPALVVGHPTLTSGASSRPLQPEPGDASTTRRSLGGTRSVAPQSGQRVGQQLGQHGLVGGSSPDALLPAGAVRSGAGRSTNMGSGAAVESRARNSGIAAATATRKVAHRVPTGGSPVVVRGWRSPVRGGIDTAGPVDRGTPTLRSAVRKQMSQTVSGTTAREGSTTAGAVGLLERGRRMAVAATALLLIALGAIWLLTRLRRLDGGGAPFGHSQAPLGRRGGVVVAGIRGVDRGRQA